MKVISTLHLMRAGNDIHSRLPIHTGSETDTHAHCIPGRVAGRIDLSYIINSGETHCTLQCYKLNRVCTLQNNSL